MYRIATSALLIGLLISLPGCQILSAILDKAGPEQVESPVYVMPKDTVLILVESYHNPSSVEVLSEHIDRLIAAEFIHNKVAPVINPDRLTVLRHADSKAYRQMKIPAIGTQLGARQVLYVDISDFTIDAAMGTEALKGHAEAKVKMVDCITGLTRWPHDATSAGFPVTIEIPFAPDAQTASDPAVREQIARSLASKVAKLFYSHPVDQTNDAPNYPETEMP